jgi:hypothetical protein
LVVDISSATKSYFSIFPAEVANAESWFGNSGGKIVKMLDTKIMATITINRKPYVMILVALCSTDNGDDVISLSSLRHTEKLHKEMH